MSRKKASPVKSWNCQCGIRWYNCSKNLRCNSINVHSPSIPISAKCKSHKRKSSSSSIQCQNKKTALHSYQTSFDHLLEDDLRRANNKRKRDECDSISLGYGTHQIIPSSLLGPSLRKKVRSGVIIAPVVACLIREAMHAWVRPWRTLELNSCGVADTENKRGTYALGQQ